MKLVTYCDDIKQLELLRELNISEVVVCSKDLSRLGKLDIESTNQILNLAKSWGMRTTLEWDVLMTESRFDEHVLNLREINLENVDVLRVQDPGALQYCLENLSQKIQYICETGNHNLVALKTWKNLIGDRLDRLVISPELPKETIRSYVQELAVDLELLGLGKILVFYTPRNLLSPLTPKQNDDFIEAMGSSEESPHKGFPLVENKHGTFMFNIRDQFLMEHLDELEQMSLTHLRVDLRDCDFRLIEKLVEMNASFSLPKAQEFKELYGRAVMKGYYRVNKSDVLFPKLKNHRLQGRGESYIGEVIDVDKKNFLAISVKNNALKLGQIIKITNTEGKVKEVEITKLQNSCLENINEAKQNIALINFVSGIQPRSQLFVS